MYLAKMTTAQAKEAFEKDPIIVIPVGSTEQHGTQVGNGLYGTVLSGGSCGGCR